MCTLDISISQHQCVFNYVNADVNDDVHSDINNDVHNNVHDDVHDDVHRWSVI